MGLYSDHWTRYKQQSIKSTVQLVFILAFGLPLIAAFGYLLSPLDNLRTATLGAFIICWLVAFTVLAVRGSKVDCPRCSATYSRGKSLVTCPKCGLRMLQDDP